MSMSLSTARGRLAAAQARLTKARATLAQRRQAVKAQKTFVATVKRRVATRTATVAAIVRRQTPAGPWMPGATRDPVTSIGRCTVGEPAGLLHTTEGLDFAGMDWELKRKRAEPHFLVGTGGQIKQYRPIGDAATALEHPAGTVETNRKRVVQIEVCATAAWPHWPEAQKQAVARIMAFCRQHGVPLTCGVSFTDAAHVHRLSPTAWLAYRGWCGHQHAPAQPAGHWDPGAIDVRELLAIAAKL